MFQVSSLGGKCCCLNPCMDKPSYILATNASHRKVHHHFPWCPLHFLEMFDNFCSLYDCIWSWLSCSPQAPGIGSHSKHILIFDHIFQRLFLHNQMTPFWKYWSWCLESLIMATFSSLGGKFLSLLSHIQCLFSSSSFSQSSLSTFLLVWLLMTSKTFWMRQIWKT